MPAVKNIIFSLFLLLSFIYLFILQIQAIWSFTIDDMYIPLRYAKHWADGQGLLWNIGEAPVEGYSNFSFLVLGRIAISLGFDPIEVLKAAGALGLLVSGIGVYAITRLWLLPNLAFIPVLWLWMYKGEILWSISGLETSVYQACLLSTVFFIFRGWGYTFIQSNIKPERQAPNAIYLLLSGLILGFANLTRPEATAVFLLFLILIFMLFPKTHIYKLLLGFCLGYALVFAPYFIWRLFYFGKLFPNPVYCKGISNFDLSLVKNYLYLIWPFVLLALPAMLQKKDTRHYFLWLPSLLYISLLMKADPIVAFDNRLFLSAFALLLPLSIAGLRAALNLAINQNFKVFKS